MLCLMVFLHACASHERVRCDGRLSPINATVPTAKAAVAAKDRQ
jgi:hypothetical protein